MDCPLHRKVMGPASGLFHSGKSRQLERYIYPLDTALVVFLCPFFCIQIFMGW